MALLNFRDGAAGPVLARIAMVVAVLGEARSARTGTLAAQARAQVDTASRALATDSVLEYRVKAAYLLNFTRYVDWPTDSGPSASGPLVLCVYGANPFGPLLDRIVAGRKSHGRPLAVRKIDTAAETKDCHLVFVSGAEWHRQPDIIPELARPGVLTVGEGVEFAAAGGVIGLVVEDQTVRFVVNRAAGDQAGLRLSSRMLAIASRLYGEPKPAEGP